VIEPAASEKVKCLLKNSFAKFSVKYGSAGSTGKEA